MLCNEISAPRADVPVHLMSQEGCRQQGITTNKTRTGEGKTGVCCVFFGWVLYSIEDCVDCLGRTAYPLDIL